MGPLECYSCGGPKSLKSSCDDFHHENSDYKETCETHMKSCIKTYGAFKNISGMFEILCLNLRFFLSEKVRLYILTAGRSPKQL